MTEQLSRLAAAAEAHGGKIVHDPEALWIARFEVRRAYEAIKRLRQADPSMRDLLNTLDELCVDLSTEIDSIQGVMELRDVRVISVAPGIERVVVP